MYKNRFGCIKCAPVRGRAGTPSSDGTVSFWTTKVSRQVAQDREKLEQFLRPAMMDDDNVFHTQQVDYSGEENPLGKGEEIQKCWDAGTNENFFMEWEKQILEMEAIEKTIKEETVRTREGYSRSLEENDGLLCNMSKFAKKCFELEEYLAGLKKESKEFEILTQSIERSSFFPVQQWKPSRLPTFHNTSMQFAKLCSEAEMQFRSCISRCKASFSTKMAELNEVINKLKSHLARLSKTATTENERSKTDEMDFMRADISSLSLKIKRREEHALALREKIKEISRKAFQLEKCSKSLHHQLSTVRTQIAQMKSTR